MLKKLSELSYKIDNSSTITVNLGDGGILKMSPAEILCMADEILRKQAEENKLVCAESVYYGMLKTLDIPSETVDNIKRRLRGEPEPIPVAEEPQKESIKEHERLLQ